MNDNKNTAVISVVGKDRVGIIYGVSKLLAEYGINIKDISQTVMSDNIFTMIMMVDLNDVKIESSDISEKLNELGKSLDLQINIQHTGLFNAMHRL
ncbi:MAG: ACT domain-containing protein [Clostridiales bacterium]|nr:ACT domain-containing protein [Clostridiales bacterium]